MQVSKKNQSTVTPVGQDFEDVIKFGNHIYEEDRTIAKNQIKTLNETIRKYLKNPEQTNLNESAEQIKNLWLIKTKADAGLNILQQDKALCNESTVLYRQFTLKLYQQVDAGKNKIPELPENFREFYAKQEALKLIKNEKQQPFQNKANIKALTAIEKAISEARDIGELRFGLNQLKLYSSFQTISPLVNSLKNWFSPLSKLQQRIEHIQNVAEGPNPM